MSAAAATFELIAVSKIQSASLLKLGASEFAIGIKISPTVNQLKIKMVRQLLVSHFTCPGENLIDEQKVKAKIHSLVQKIIRKNVDECSKFLMNVHRLENALDDQLAKNEKLEAFEVKYNGDVKCEYGRDGVIILDNSLHEAIFVFSPMVSPNP